VARGGGRSLKKIFRGGNQDAEHAPPHRKTDIRGLEKQRPTAGGDERGEKKGAGERIPLRGTTAMRVPECEKKAHWPLQRKTHHRRRGEKPGDKGGPPGESGRRGGKKN